MKNILYICFFMLFTWVGNAQITPIGNSGASMTSYTNGTPNDPIYIWCGDELGSNSGSLSITPVGAGPFTFRWYFHNETSSSWDLYSTSSGASSTISNLPSDGYRVEVRDNNNNLVGCYTAWVWNLNAEVTADATPNCDSADLIGEVSANSSFTYYNPPPSEAIITANTQITVCFSAVHTYVSDLAFYLVAPGGGPTILLSPNPGANGQGPVCNSNNNVNSLCFSTLSSNNFDPCIPETGCGNQTACTSNYTGVYGSYGPGHTPINWSPLYGINAAQGGWAVQIYDCIGIDVGALTNASITFTNLSTTCGGSSFISYNSGMISSAINDNSCSAATASIFEVPLATLGPGITIDAIVNTLWTSNTSASITNPIDLNTTANNLPVGTTEFTLVTNILYGNAICTQTATTSVISTGGPVVPEFDGVDSVCLGQDSPLPLVSDNGVVGVWTPAFNNTQTETYTFIPDEGQCAEEITLTVTVNPEIEPTFNPIFPICQGDFLAPNTLPTTSLEGITGSWSPALNNQVTTTYTFTPHPDQCAIPTTLTIEVTPKISPTFSNIRLEYCQGDTMQPLPLMSNNSPTPVLGTWFPPLNNQQTTTYTFVPAAGQCANQVQVTIAIKPYTTPQFIPVPPICAGDFLAPLPNTSINGITGSWSPALNNMETTTYTFTPTMHSGSIGGQCGEVVQMTIVVNQPAVPAFNLNTNICAGTDLTLPTISNNGIEGSWSPAFDNTQTTTYTFTPNPDECAEPFVVTINVNDPVTPTFNPVADICAGANLNPLPTTSLNGVSGTWSPALNNQATTTYTFTPNASECAVPTTLTIVVDQPIVPLFDQVASTCSGDFIAPLPTTSNNGITGTWSPALNYNQTTTYTFTPTAGICATEATMTITVTQPATPVFAQVAAICAGRSEEHTSELQSRPHL